MPSKAARIGTIVLTARLARDERGAALVLALMVLLTLTGLALAILSVSAFEAQISRNHNDTVRARYVAEAGIEYAYDTLATNVSSWNTYLAGATCLQGAVLGTANSSLPGLGSVHGTFTVRVRNDCNAGDDKLTGVGLDTIAGHCAEVAGTATLDANCRVIVTSTGTIGNTTRTITVVVAKTGVPATNAALAFPGIQADVNLIGPSVVIDGRDTKMADNPGAPTGTAPAVYGISVNGTLPALAVQVENALGNSQQTSVRGRDETNSGGTTQGAGTIQADGALTSQAIIDFLAAVRSMADITINTSPGNTHSISNIGSTCSTDVKSSTCWGTTSRPKIVYISGTLSGISTQYTSLIISGDSTGTGILIIENGNVEISGNFRWNGPIIVSGTNVGIRYRGDGTQSVYGATVINELHDDGASNLEGDIQGTSSILYSRETLDLVQTGLGRRLVTTYGWTDQ